MNYHSNILFDFNFSTNVIRNLQGYFISYLSPHSWLKVFLEFDHLISLFHKAILLIFYYEIYHSKNYHTHVNS
jgi:hypothetical protein